MTDVAQRGKNVFGDTHLDAETSMFGAAEEASEVWLYAETSLVVDGDVPVLTPLEAPSIPPLRHHQRGPVNAVLASSSSAQQYNQSVARAVHSIAQRRRLPLTQQQLQATRH